MADTRNVQLKLESTIDSVDAVELIVQGLAREIGYDQDEIDRLGVAIRETMVNAVTHGNGYSRNKAVHFAASSGNDGLKVTIRDEGEGFDLENVPDPTAPENLLKASGRGLLLMRTLVDEFDLRRGEPVGMEAVLVKHAPSKKQD